MAFNGTGANVTTLNASNISSGTVATARLGSGTANNTTFLRGDSTYASVAGAPNPLHGKEVFTSTGTFNVPTGVTTVKVTVIGAAGNGANGVVCSNAGGGGGSGGYVVDYVAVTSGGTATVTVGTSAGARTSSFAGGTTITASGGTNGTNTGGESKMGNSAAATVFGLTYGVLGPNRKEDNLYGADSRADIRLSGTSPSNTTSGAVYAHGYGIAGSNRTFVAGSLSCHIPIGYGAGGGGGRQDGAYLAGGAGANGLVVVEW